AASLAVAMGVAWQLRPLPETGVVPTPSETGPLRAVVPAQPQDSHGDAPPPPMTEMAMPVPADAPVDASDAASATPQARRAAPVSEIAQEAAPVADVPPMAAPRTQAAPPTVVDAARQAPVDRPTAAPAAAAQTQEELARARAAQARDEARRVQPTRPAMAAQPAILPERTAAPPPPPAPPAPPAPSKPAPKASAPAPAPAEPGSVPAPPPPATAVFSDDEAEVQLRLQPPAAPAPPPAESATPDAVDAFADQPLDEQPPASADSPAVREAWLQRIRELRETGRLDEARASLREFVRRHPQAAVPDDLRPLLEE